MTNNNHTTAFSGSRAPRRSVVRKVLNNNLVITVDPAGRELVLMGRGLGWGLKVNDPVDFDRVEKTYVLDQGGDSAHMQKVLADIPFPIIEAVADAVDDAARTLGRQLSRHLPVAIIDHVRFVVERLGEGTRVPAPNMPELVALYPDEVAAAERMRERLSVALGMSLPPEESVFLTMHLLNSTREGNNQTAAVLFRRTQRIITIVQSALSTAVAPSSPEHARFVLHVKFLLQRVAAGRMLRGTDTSLYDLARHSYPRAHRVAESVREYLHAETAADVTDEEVLYLIMHIQRLTPSETISKPVTRP